MLRLNILRGVVAGAAMLTVIGCASTNGEFASSKHSSKTSGIGDVARFYGEEITPRRERELLKVSTLYFGFDCYEIDEESKLVVLAHAKKLLENPKLRLRISGHTDNRGSRAYNVGLGERRAKAVAGVLALKGVPADRVVVVSYGKEKPAALGNDEEAWNLNRRAELDYEANK